MPFAVDSTCLILGVINLVCHTTHDVTQTFIRVVAQHFLVCLAMSSVASADPARRRQRCKTRDVIAQEDDDTVCFLCLKTGDSPPSVKDQGDWLHTRCRNAVRSHGRTLKHTPALRGRYKKMRKTDPDQGRADITPFVEDSSESRAAARVLAETRHSMMIAEYSSQGGAPGAAADLYETAAQVLEEDE